MTAPNGLAYYVWQYSPTRRGKGIYVPQIRVFPNIPGAKWEIPIHEQILPSLVRHGVKTQLTNLKINHAGYYEDDTVYQKHLRNLPLLQEQVRLHPEDQFSRGNLERALQYEAGMEAMRL